MARISRISADGRTIKTTSTCGCVTFFAFLLVIAIPIAFFGVFAIPAFVGLGLILALAVFLKGRGNKVTSTSKSSLDPEKDDAYWAEYVARVSGSPAPPPMPPPVA
ncbi:MAG TPA: hypothetical protein VII58_04860 [Acidobacteriaceae bacterium]